jgi:Acetyltransferase (GNAT) domain
MVTQIVNAGVSLAGTPTQPGLRIIEVDIHSDPRWEKFVDSHPDSTIFHHPLWLQVLEKEYKQRRIALACEDHQGNLQAILPLLFTRGLPLGIGGSLAGRRLSSLPRTPIAGPLASTREASVALLRAAMNIVQKTRKQTLQIKALGALLDGPVEGLVQRPWRTSYAVALPEERRKLGEEECFEKFGPCETCRVLRFGNCGNHRKVTWAVKKARSSDMSVTEAQSETELREWYQIYLETMRRNCVPPRPYRLFQACWELLRPRGYMRLLVAQPPSLDRMIGGSVLFTYRDKTFAGFAACRQKDFPLHPNDLLHWVGIHDACRQGCQTYDFGEVPGDAPDLARFKRKWNCGETQLWRYYYSLDETSDSGSDAQPFAKKVAARLWGCLPLKGTAVLGDWIYSCL